MSSSQIVLGSLASVAQRNGQPVATAFLGAKIMAIVDTSSSMGTPDGRESQTRYTMACRELTALQAKHPGEVAVVSFSSDVVFCPGGVPTYLGATTDLAAALGYAKTADGTMGFIVISDGEPDNEEEALAVATRFESQIDTVYIGPPGGDGAGFLRRLSAAAGGRHVTTEVGKLCDHVEQLMLTAGGAA